MISKAQLLNSLNTLPDNISVDQLIEHLLLLEKIQLGLADAKAGKVNSKEEARNKLSKWLK